MAFDSASSASIASLSRDQLSGGRGRESPKKLIVMANREVGYGLSAEVAKKMAGKYDIGMEKQARCHSAAHPSACGLPPDLVPGVTGSGSTS